VCLKWYPSWVIVDLALPIPFFLFQYFRSVSNDWGLLFSSLIQFALKTRISGNASKRDSSFFTIS
jgi:hypothetical protein